MTQKEFEKQLVFLNWNNREAGTTLGVSERSIYNYLRGNKPVPLYIEKSVLCFSKMKNLHLLTGKMIKP